MKSTPTKTLAIRGAIFNWMGYVCAVVIAFFLTPYLVHKLGDSRYGLWSIAMSLMSYYALADFGLRGATVKFIAQYHAGGDPQKMRNVVATSLVGYAVIAVVVAIICTAVALLAPKIYATDGVADQTIVYIVLLTGCTVVIQLMSQVFGASLIALQRHDLANVILVSQLVMQAVAVVSALQLGYGLLGMAWATLAVVIVFQGIRVAIAKRLLPELSVSLHDFDRQTLRTVFRFGSVNALVNVGRQIAQRSGSILIGAMINPAAVAYYAIAESLAEKAQRVCEGVTRVIDPMASRLDGRQARSALVVLMDVASRVMLAIALCFSIMLIVMGRRFLELWIGPAFAERSYPVLCILALAIVPRMASDPMRSILRGIDKLSVLVRAAVVEISITLTLAPILIWSHGLVGMAAAILVAQSVSGFVILPVGTCAALDQDLRRFVRQSWIPPLGVAVVTLAAAAAMRALPAPTRLLVMLAEFAVVGGVAGVATLFLCLDGQRRHDIFVALPRLRMRRSTPTVCDTRTDQSDPLAVSTNR